VGQVGVTGIAIECELEDCHSGQIEFLAKTHHITRDESEILDHDPGMWQRIVDSLEQRTTRSTVPLTVLGGFVGSRDAPVGSEATEVVNPGDIDTIERAAEAADPPGIALIFQCGPIVKRISLALPGR